MELERDLLEKVRKLSPDGQRQVLDFAEYLARKARATQPFKSPRGLFKGLGPAPTASEIDEAKRESWNVFPRDDI